jgi:hypothetical protein
MKLVLVVAVVLGLVAACVAFGQQPAAPDQSEAGPQASATVVPPVPTPAIAEGNTGLAAKYPGDVGIEKDPDVVFAENFEGTVDEICSKWEQVAGQPIMSKSDDILPGSGGKQSLLLTRVAGGTEGYQDGGNLYRRLKNDKGGYGYDQLFFRFYMKFNKEHAPIHHYGSGFWGYNPPSQWPMGGAGVRPKGNQSWITQVEPGDFKSWVMYTYWQNMGGSPPRGQTWGNTFEIGVPPRPVEKEKWICLEVMVKMNDIGDTNGEQAYWLDGKLSRDAQGRVTSYLGKGFPSVGTWTFDKFKPYVTEQGITWDYQQGKGVDLAGGKPFPGFAWRNVPELNVNAIWLYRYMDPPEPGTSKVWWDNLVIAKKYIGPLTPVSPSAGSGR